MLIHDTDMTIPIFNSLYEKNNNSLKSNNLNIKILNNLELDRVDKKKFPLIKLIDGLTDKDSLFETVIVSANDKLVGKFLKNEIKFNDISKNLQKVINLKEFQKFKMIEPKNVQEIAKLADYVSLKIKSMSV